MDFFDFFQVAALIFLVTTIAGRAIYLRLAKGIVSFTLGKGKRGFHAALEVFFLVALVFWLAEVLLVAMHARFRFFHAPLDAHVLDMGLARAIGVIFVSLGIGLFVWALVSFGDSWRVGIDKQKPGGLVTRGVFSFSRNPIFVFINLYATGTFFLNGTLFFLLSAMLVAAGLHYQILQEESLLRQLYGEAYERYCAQTGRYFSLRRR